MINAHCQQSPVVYCNEKKLYQFRIFEFKSEPFCEERNSALLSRSCDNVTQKLKQAERNKRLSDSFPFQYWTRMSNQRSQLFSRTKSLPVDLSECGRDYLCRDHSRDDHMLLTNKYIYTRDHMKRRTNGFHNNHKENHTSCGMLKLVEDNKGELRAESNSQGGNDLPLSHAVPHDTNGDIMHNDDLLERQCAKMNSNLNQLSNRYQKEQLEAKSKEELISIVLELQDALNLVTDG
ncbi:uncharacterized protein LOC114541255 [Dendronephthya gigantea]|uniref:uncharacterized protein LOC114541255 n=1 Tax=Dendronephthya gigantea TaxID=151771 RepID=UPI00106CE546|nr:uncharacterized protein LOC114541255 [Dendronephthya gigantea]